MPVSLVFSDGLCEDRINSPVDPFDCRVRDRPIGSATEVLDPHHSGKMRKDRVDKLRDRCHGPGVPRHRRLSTRVSTARWRLLMQICHEVEQLSGTS